MAMPSGIVVTPERLREVSAQMSTGADDVQAILSRLSDNVAPVRSEWAGPAQAHFNALWDQLQKDANGLHSVLTGIAKLTEKAAAAYEEAEQKIARSFDEFRLEPRVVDTVSENHERADVLTEIESYEPADVLTEIALDSESTPSPVPTETDGDSGEATDESAGPQKSSPRLPWARFMTKGVQASQTCEMPVSPRVRERRFKTSDPDLKSGTRLCRLCFTVVILEPEYIEMSGPHTYVSCPHCGRSFPIRRSDVETSLIGQALPPSS
jgi:WXG100 family type VII secretion target